MNFLNLFVSLLLFTIGFSSQAQKLKVEWVAGEVTFNKKGSNETLRVKKNESIDLADRIFLGENALLVVSDYSKKLFEVKKKGYITGKELSEGLLKTADNEYQRYLAYILKELKTHESEMKATDKGIPGAPSRGEEFGIVLPDTLMLFNDEQVPIRWLNSANTDLVNFQLITDKKNLLLDLDFNGDLFWFNNISTYFIITKSLHFYVYERRTDGKKLQKGHMVIMKSAFKEEEIKKELEDEFKVFQDPRLNLIAKAKKWEINYYYLEALDTYKILMLDYPNDEMVNLFFDQFKKRTGFE